MVVDHFRGEVMKMPNSTPRLAAAIAQLSTFRAIRFMIDVGWSYSPTAATSLLS